MSGLVASSFPFFAKNSVFSRLENLTPVLAPTVITAIFAVFNLLGLLRHELWRDEFQAWMVARDSGSVLEMLQHLRNEGHPALWHMCLYGLAQWSHNPWLMQAFHGLIAIATVSLIQHFSPFKLTHKILLTFSYFIVYEYAIISRNYGLGAFFLFSFCAAFCQSRHLFSLALILVLLANTNLFGLLLSFSLAILLLFRWWDQRREKHARSNFVGTLVILGTGWLISMAQIARPLWEPLLAKHTGRLGFMPLSQTVAGAVIPEGVEMTFPVKVAYTLVQIWQAYVPIPTFAPRAFWDTNILLDSPFMRVRGLAVGLGLGLLISAALVVWAVRLLGRRSPRLALVYLVGTGLILLFCMQFFWWGSLRHQGYLWLLLVACLWLAQANVFPQELGRSRPLRLQGFTLLLALQCFAGVYLYSQDLAYSFSAGQQTARFIRQNHLEQLTLVGLRDREASVLSGYLEQPLYYPEGDRVGSFWDIYEKPVPPEELGRRIEAIATQTHQDLLLIWSRPLDIPLESLTVTPLATFKSKLIDSECFYLYRAQSQPVDSKR